MRNGEKWAMFTNFMHNELHITKEDIREWIKEAVAEQARLLTDQTYTNFSPERIIQKIIMDHSIWSSGSVKSDIIKEAGRIIIDRLDIKLKE